MTSKFDSTGSSGQLHLRPTNARVLHVFPYNAPRLKLRLLFKKLLDSQAEIKRIVSHFCVVIPKAAFVAALVAVRLKYGPA